MHKSETQILICGKSAVGRNFNSLGDIYNEDTDDDEFDDLADFFGRYFMCPIPYLLIKGIEMEEEIVSACHVSMEAAGNAASNIRNRKRKYGNRIFDYEIPLLEHLDKDAYEIFIRNQGNEI